MNGGELILLRGIDYKIVINKYPGKNPKVFFRDGYFEVYINKNGIMEDNKAAVEAAFGSWYAKKAEEVFTERLEYYADIMGVKYNNVCIRSQKTRWGSCSSKGNLNFNWRLVMAPEWVIDYVVVHELSHLKLLNHSKDFWNIVFSYFPEYKKAVAWLKENGAALNLNYI